MAQAKPPVRIEIHAYQVGFGDCFLLRFEYPARARHVLIDFGSTGLPKTASPGRMEAVAKDIGEVCGRKLDAVVATHRHKDHISGFAKDAASGRLIASYRPELVIQPWTEDPRAEPSARKPTRVLQGAQAFVRSLSRMQEVAASALAEIGEADGASPFGKSLTKELRFLGEDNLKNAAAVENLMTMSPKRVYAHFGSRHGLERLLPGVKVTVLGPPTLEQSAAIAAQRSRDDAEFWHFQALAGAAARSTSARPFGATQTLKGTPPPYARWFIPRMHALRGDQLLEIVRILDEAMNNTSLILLFEAGGQKLLFPGDAQLENWMYCLGGSKRSPRIRALLREVTFYKVGHHGSLNATPKKSLWDLFGRRSPKAGDGRLKTLVSTLRGKHGTATRGTEVPRKALVDAMTRESEFRTTESIKGRKALKHVVTLDLGAGSGP